MEKIGPNYLALAALVPLSATPVAIQLRSLMPKSLVVETSIMQHTAAASIAYDDVIEIPVHMKLVELTHRN